MNRIAMQRVRSTEKRLKWWINDISFKAPEQVGLQYTMGLLNDLNATLNGESVDPWKCCECEDMVTTKPMQTGGAPICEDCADSYDQCECCELYSSDAILTEDITMCRNCASIE